MNFITWGNSTDSNQNHKKNSSRPTEQLYQGFLEVALHMELCCK